jgi:glycosyltransferase involved in cell wall biosynthesis
MRIAYVINSVEGGGAAAPVPAVCRTLQREGAEIAIFALTGRDRRGLAAMEAAGFEVTVRPGGEKDHRAALTWLSAQVTGYGADIIWTSLTRATLLGQIVGDRLRLPVVSWQHAAYLKPANRLLLRLRQRKSALWIADSDSVAELTRRKLAIPAERLVSWPLFAADGSALQAKPWRRGETVRIGSLGRLHPVKGYDILLAALALLKKFGFGGYAPFEVSIAGEGAEREGLEKTIAQAGLANIRLVGFQGDPRAFLASIHLYVQPSRSEGFCIAAHEAMQAGLPTIGSAVGEMPHTILHRKSGFVVPPGDSDALSFAIAECLLAPEKLQWMGQMARARVLETFGAERFEATGAEIMRRLRSCVGVEKPTGVDQPPAPTAIDPLCIDQCEGTAAAEGVQPLAERLPGGIGRDPTADFIADPLRVEARER